MSAFHIEVLEHKYVALRARIIEELDRIDGRLEYYGSIERDSQTSAMEKKYIDKKSKLIVELDRVDTRLQSYAAMKSAEATAEIKQEAVPTEPATPVEESKKPAAKQKLYRGRPVA